MSEIFEKLRALGKLRRADCGGKGLCGACRIRFLKNAPLPTPAERRLLTPDELRRGIRLACRTSLKEKELAARLTRGEILFSEEEAGGEAGENAGGVIRIDEASSDKDVISAAAQGIDKDKHAAAQTNDTGKYAPEEKAGTVTSGKTLRAVSAYVGEEALLAAWQPREGYVLCIDLGTTTVVMELRDGRTGGLLHTEGFANPQRVYGVDVLSRIQAAGEGRADIMRSLIRDALLKGLEDCLSSLHNSKADRRKTKIFLAGNTAMLHLLLGYDVSGLGRAPFTPCSLEAEALTLRGRDGMTYTMRILPGISAFVGADILAGLYGTEFGRATDLFVDLGTNGEMALGNREKYYCTATAAGSAFGQVGPKCRYAPPVSTGRVLWAESQQRSAPRSIGWREGARKRR